VLRVGPVPLPIITCSPPNSVLDTPPGTLGMTTLLGTTGVSARAQVPVVTDAVFLQRVIVFDADRDGDDGACVAIVSPRSPNPPLTLRARRLRRT
jgi:hypothetical protein